MNCSAFEDSLVHWTKFNTAELVWCRAKKEVKHTWLYQGYVFCLQNAKQLVQRRDKKNRYLVPSFLVLTKVIFSLPPSPNTSLFILSHLNPYMAIRYSRNNRHFCKWCILPSPQIIFEGNHGKLIAALKNVLIRNVSLYIGMWYSL